MSREFVHLHVHSDYSLDSVIQLGALCRRVSDLGMPAVALTDHIGLMGVVEFYNKARDAGIKPIIGCEVLVSRGPLSGVDVYPSKEQRHHLILLAENDDGYRNLVRIVSVPRFGAFPGEPIIDKQFLRRHSKGLIATSACAKGEISSVLNRVGEKAAANVLQEYRDIFDGGRFFLEVQDTGLPDEPQLNENLMRLGRRTGVPVVATANCHHIDRGDARELEILLCLKKGQTISERIGRRFPPPGDYVKSRAQMERVFGDVFPESLDNTLAIAERCNVTLKSAEMVYPSYECPGGLSQEAYLRRLAFDGLALRLRQMAVRGKAITPAEEGRYRRGLENELEIVRECEASAYFLVAWDCVRYARETGIPMGPGRGSAPGSLLAYTLRLTDIDPIAFGLHFERFLNPLRSRVPDIDFDFCRTRRDELFSYIEGKYGRANVARVSTFGRLKGPAAIGAVRRILERPEADVEEVVGMMNDMGARTIASALDGEPQLRIMAAVNPEVGELISRAGCLEGVVLDVSCHAAAVAISAGPLKEKVPVFDVGGAVVTQFPIRGLEKAGVTRIDLLGFRVLTEIGEATRRIRERTGIGIDVSNLPLDDMPTFEMISREDVAGVFQCQYRGFVDMLLRMKPETFSHLLDALTLFRPGPLRLGMADEYLSRRHGRSGPIGVAVPETEDILGETFGIILYQEQLIDLAGQIAGFSMDEADLFRYAVCRGGADKYKTRFFEGAARQGHPRATVERLFGQIVREGEYSFCKAHAVAYTLITYWTAYLKCHWPEEYAAAIAAVAAAAGNSDDLR